VHVSTNTKLVLQAHVVIVDTSWHAQLVQGDQHVLQPHAS
jgi:hypothetical protein